MKKTGPETHQPQSGGSLLFASFCMPTIPPIVEAITQINITGNIVPREWTLHLKMKNGRPDPIGALVLAEIVFWYRWKKVADPLRPSTHRHERRFNSDKLQKGYSQLSQSLGFSRQQIRGAIARLKNGGYITKELRNFSTLSGVRLTSVMFLAPIPEAIQRITITRSIADKPTEQTGRQAEYAAYLQSTYWKDLRADILAAQPYCQECGDDQHLNLHHLYYYKDVCWPFTLSGANSWHSCG